MPRIEMKPNMKPQFPTVEEQIEYWNTKERLEHERVMDIRAESPNQSIETGKVDWKALAISNYKSALAEWNASNPQDQASTTAETLTQEEELSRTEATADWFDGLADTPWSLRDEGRNPNGDGESFSERNL